MDYTNMVSKKLPILFDLTREQQMELLAQITANLSETGNTTKGEAKSGRLFAAMVRIAETNPQHKVSNDTIAGILSRDYGITFESNIMLGRALSYISYKLSRQINFERKRINGKTYYNIFL